MICQENGLPEFNFEVGHDKAQGLSLGVTAYIIKPFSPQQLLDKILESLEEKR